MSVLPFISFSAYVCERRVQKASAGTTTMWTLQGRGKPRKRLSKAMRITWGHCTEKDRENHPAQGGSGGGGIGCERCEV